GHDKTLDCSPEEPGVRTAEQNKIFISGCSEEGTEQVYSNIRTIPKKSIHIDAGEIHAKEDGVYFLLKARDLFDGCSPHFFLKSSEREPIWEGLPRLESHEENETGEAGLSVDERVERNNTSPWKVKELNLTGYALGILSKLRFHEENEIETLVLDAEKPGEISEILKTENCSIWLGKVRS
ncbi:MAG: uncharacterized protein A8A55_3520, partial [Amphiamblys sp. WSBS2006]